MKYMLLVHHDEASFSKRSETERKAMLQESVQLARQLHESGSYIGAAPLHPSSETMCVRVRDGKPWVTDGPFAETREQLGGYFLIHARDEIFFGHADLGSSDLAFQVLHKFVDAHVG